MGKKESNPKPPEGIKKPPPPTGSTEIEKAYFKNYFKKTRS